MPPAIHRSLSLVICAFNFASVRPTAVYHLSGSRVGSYRPVWCRIESQTERCVGIATKQRHCETDEGKGTVKYSSGKLSPSFFSLLSLLFPLLSLLFPLLSSPPFSLWSSRYLVIRAIRTALCPRRRRHAAPRRHSTIIRIQTGEPFYQFFYWKRERYDPDYIPSNHAGLRSSGRFCPLGPFVLAKLAF